MTQHVAILGCGPAGMMAALAADLSGWDFTIFSRREKSKLFGAQYLHKELPAIECGEPKLVQYQLRGTPEMYRSKVYGEDWDGTVSPEDYEADHYAWDIRRAYDELWSWYHTEIRDTNIIGRSHPAAPFMKDLNKFDMVISSVPRTLWDPDLSNFYHETIWALGDAEFERVSSLHRPEPFTVICNGHKKPLWYRVSNIFGYATMEWPTTSYIPEAGEVPPTRGASIVIKPLRHESTAASDFVHIGRYGKWEKGVLTTDAFDDSVKALADCSIGAI